MQRAKSDYVRVVDCMLQNGAAKVYAVDVGHGQLAWKLRGDERVVCMEQTNFRYVVPEDIGEPLETSGTAMPRKRLPRPFSFI